MLTNKPHLLIIEDDPSLRYFLVRALERSYLITEAEDGLEGLKKALITPPDIILLDIMLPHLDGYQACELLRKESSLDLVPIVMMSTAIGAEVRTRVLKCGADGYIAKPFDLDELTA